MRTVQFTAFNIGLIENATGPNGVPLNDIESTVQITTKDPFGFLTTFLGFGG